MPFRYKFTGDAPALIPAIHRELTPGEEFDSDIALEGAVFEPLADLDVSEPPKEAA
jgi:hypothetical protein